MPLSTCYVELQGEKDSVLKGTEPQSRTTEYFIWLSTAQLFIVQQEKSSQGCLCFKLPGCEDLVGAEKPAGTTEGQQLCSGISGLCLMERRLPYVPLGISWNDNGLLSVPSC